MSIEIDNPAGEIRANGSPIGGGGGASAWCYCSGGSLLGGSNISSITRHGTGDYEFHFTTAMPNANYAAIADGGQDGVSFGNSMLKSRSTTSVRFTFEDHVQTPWDTVVSLVVFSS